MHLQRVFGFGDPALTDPFLMMDDFRNDDQRFYSKGFPWHPHRRIETITYVLDSQVEHADLIGNWGLIGAGAVQYLPSALKMTAPRYQDVAAGDIPIGRDDGTTIKVIIGSFCGKIGPVVGIATKPAAIPPYRARTTAFWHPAP